MFNPFKAKYKIVESLIDSSNSTKFTVYKKDYRTMWTWDFVTYTSSIDAAKAVIERDKQPKYKTVWEGQ